MEVADTLKFLARSKVVEPKRKDVSQLKTVSKPNQTYSKAF